MQPCSRANLNCGGGSVGGGVGDVLFPNPNRRTPDHPPYSEMVAVALRTLAEENGSTESSISVYIQSTFNDLPWGHDRLLPYYLRKFVADGELTSPSADRYQLPFHPLPSVSLPIRRRGRPRLYPPNPKPSDPPRHRGRSHPYRRRGRPPKIYAEDTPPLHLEQGSPPLRRVRGRLRLRRGDSIGRTATRRLGIGIPRSRVSMRREDIFLVSNTEELNCQSGNSAFFNDSKNGDSECGVLEDPEHIELRHAQLEQGQPFVAPEQSEVGKGQFLGEEQPLMIPEPGTVPPFLAPEQYKHVEGQPLRGEEPPFLAPEQTEFSQDQLLLGEKLPLSTPEQGKLLSFLAPELCENDQGQSMQGEAPPFMLPEQTEFVQVHLSPTERLPFLTPETGEMPPFLAPELCEHDQGQSMQGEAPPFMLPEQTEFVQVQLSPRERLPFLTPETGKMPRFLAPELFEHDQGQLPQGEALPFMSPDLIELVQKQSSEGPPLLSPEQPEHDHGQLLGSPEESEDGHEQRLAGVGAADPKEWELVLMPRPDEEEAEKATVSNKKRKSHGKRKSLRLWFES